MCKDPKKFRTELEKKTDAIAEACLDLAKWGTKDKNGCSPKHLLVSLMLNEITDSLSQLVELVDTLREIDAVREMSESAHLN